MNIHDEECLAVTLWTASIVIFPLLSIVFGGFLGIMLTIPEIALIWASSYKLEYYFDNKRAILNSKSH
jgi:hypothetical protein